MDSRLGRGCNLFTTSVIHILKFTITYYQIRVRDAIQSFLISRWFLQKYMYLIELNRWSSFIDISYISEVPKMPGCSEWFIISFSMPLLNASGLQYVLGTFYWRSMWLNSAIRMKQKKPRSCVTSDYGPYFYSPLIVNIPLCYDL